MSEGEIKNAHEVTFESLRHVDDSGTEYWLARELQPVLEYGTWDKFRRVIEKAIVAAEQSKLPAQDHFSRVGKMVALGLGTEREIEDFELSRYACYLIVQNGDPSKPVIANGQTYFAIQTRRAELADDEQFRQLTEDQKRVFLRGEAREHNKLLVETAQRAGVESPQDFAVFQDHGYRGLYGGLGARDDVVGKDAANQTHHEVGKRVREAIADIGGTMPEDLPTPARSAKELEREQNRLEGGDGGSASTARR